MASTVVVPVVAPVTGSLTVTGVGPAAYTVLDPGSVKLVTFTAVLAGGTELANRLTVMGPAPAVTFTASLLSRSRGATVMVSGTCCVWPSELVTVAVSVGTGPV